jgi:quinolinate synthase
MDNVSLIKKIKQISLEKNALIIAHNYQNPEIQDIADHVGDSYELSKIAADNKSDIIVFCGVHFMAESAAILAPQKKILLPELSAGCPMAEMIDAKSLIAFKNEYPESKVVTYINSTAEVKAESDVICTSSNAVKITNNIDSNEIIFIPDKNLGKWVAKQSNKIIHLWKGFCPVHANVSLDDILRCKSLHPQSLLMVHPECDPSIVEIADEVLSTGGMVNFVKSTKATSIIVGTETGMIHKLKSVAPHIEYIAVADSFVCPNMKKITLEKVYNSLLYEVNEIRVDPDISFRARKALNMMLELSV